MTEQKRIVLNVGRAIRLTVVGQHVSLESVVGLADNAVERYCTSAGGLLRRRACFVGWLMMPLISRTAEPRQLPALTRLEGCQGLVEPRKHDSGRLGGRLVQVTTVAKGALAVKVVDVGHAVWSLL